MEGVDLSRARSDKLMCDQPPVRTSLADLPLFKPTEGSQVWDVREAESHRALGQISLSSGLIWSESDGQDLT